MDHFKGGGSVLRDLALSCARFSDERANSKNAHWRPLYGGRHPNNPLDVFEESYDRGPPVGCYPSEKPGSQAKAMPGQFREVLNRATAVPKREGDVVISDVAPFVFMDKGKRLDLVDCLSNPDSRLVPARFSSMSACCAVLSCWSQALEVLRQRSPFQPHLAGLRVRNRRREFGCLSRRPRPDQNRRCTSRACHEGWRAEVLDQSRYPRSDPPRAGPRPQRASCGRRRFRASGRAQSSRPCWQARTRPRQWT